MVRIGYVSQDKHLMQRIEAIFPEWDLQFDRIAPDHKVVESCRESWDALLLDLELFEPAANIEGIVRSAVRLARRTILMLPAHMHDAEPQLTSLGAAVICKPAAAGEVALRLQKALR